MSEKPLVLGISCFFHDSAAALVRDGVVVAAAQEERFTRKKHDSDLPMHAIRFCLEQAGATIEDVTHVVFYEKPLLKFERIIDMYVRSWPWALSSFVRTLTSWSRTKIWIEHLVREKTGFRGEFLFARHHVSHAASAYYASGFDEAAIVTLDAVGEWETTTVGQGVNNDIFMSHALVFPHSVGLLYSAVTAYLGFAVNDGEYKVMGLAPYGDRAAYREQLSRVVDRKDDGSFALDMRYFSYEYGQRMTSAKFHELFDGEPRRPEEPLTQRHRDIAASLQEMTEALVLGIAREAKRLYPSKRLCLSGGVALNCVANGALRASGLFDEIYIQPASGDAGGAVGAALYAYFCHFGSPRDKAVMPDMFLGPAFSRDEIRSFLEGDASRALGRPVVYREFEGDAICDAVADLIEGETAIGWFQGRMEFGPRALGNRSILADARVAKNWQAINQKVKFRESFRPLAPAVLEERASSYFKDGRKSPYMLFTTEVRGTGLPAVTHIDGSARVQTVGRSDNPRFWALLSAYERRTGCPVLVNTSFNVRDEPIVLSPADAFACFLRTGLDHLALGDFLLSKKDNCL